MASVKPKAYADGIPVWCSHEKIIDLVELVPNPRNPNQHPEKQIELGARIIQAHGWRWPIVVSRRSGFITKGHGRLLFAKKMGVNHVPVDYQDYESEAAEWQDIIADNRLQELAEPDTGIIADILAGVADIEAELTGYDLKDLLSVSIPDDDGFEGSPDDVETDVALGDIFQLGRHRLMCGDATNDLHLSALLGAEDPEFTFTDPPYDMDLVPVVDVLLSSGQTQLFMMVGFKQMVQLVGIKKLKPHFDIIYVRLHCRYRSIPNMKVPHIKHSHIIYFTAGKVGSIFDEHNARGAFSDTNFYPSVIEETADPETNEFFNQKDISAVCKAMSGFKFTTMLDPFCGAGTFLIACEKMDKTCFAMEIEPKNCQMIIDRWEQSTGQKALKVSI